MADLISRLNARKLSNTTSISYIEPEIAKAQEEINSFDPFVSKVDGQSVVTLNKINVLKDQIVVLSQEARASGCGTTVGASIVYPDSIDLTVENMETESYVGNNPFGFSVVQLSSSNIGIGSFVRNVPNDSRKSGLGTLYSGIGSCWASFFYGGCGDCIGYANSITKLQNEMLILKNELSNLVSNSNSLKKERRNSTLKRYGQKRTVKSLQDTNSDLDAAISTAKSLLEIQEAKSIVFDTSLKLYFDADPNNTFALVNQEGNVVRDLSGSLNDGKLYGGASISTETPYYFDFDGTDDLIDVPSEIFANSTAGVVYYNGSTGTEITAEAWVSPNAYIRSPLSQELVIIQTNRNILASGIWMDLKANDLGNPTFVYPRFRAGAGGGSDYVFDPSVRIEIGSWYMLLELMKTKDI